VIVTEPKPKVRGTGVGISTIESAVIPGFPILIVKAFAVAVIVTLFSGPAEEIGYSANAPKPNNIKYNPLKGAVGMWWSHCSHQRIISSFKPRGKT
jgi:hypothetical protein